MQHTRRRPRVIAARMEGHSFGAVMGGRAVAEGEPVAMPIVRVS